MDNNKHQSTEEQSVKTYANSETHERTWFRFMVQFCSALIISQSQKGGGLANIGFTLLQIALVVYFYRGISRTEVGRFFQFIYSAIVVILMLVYLFMVIEL